MDLQQILGRITEYIIDVSRNIERRLSIYTRRSLVRKNTPTYSWSRPNYAYWDRVYYCREPGLELSGLFVKPIVNKIAAWVLGRQPNFECKTKPSQEELTKWWDKHHDEILEGYREAIKQGDSFLVINSDLSVTIVPPDIVDPIVAEDDYSKRIGWRISQVFPHPTNRTDKMMVTDEYYADRRIRKVEFSSGRSFTETFVNLIGLIPVVHIANTKKGGEEFGHPEAEALVDLFLRYGQTLEAAVEGNILQGRPTPVLAFKTIQDLNAFWRRYGKQENITKPDGTVSQVETLTIDMSDLLTVSGAEFKYESPGTFAEDTERLLGLMFYLTLEHLEVPEFVLGNAIEGSKASAETQMPIFEIFIRMRQRDCAGWIRYIAKVVSAYNAILKPGARREEPTLVWPKLNQNGRLVKESVEWAYDKNLIDDRTSLMLLPLDIEKPDDVLKQAKKDAIRRNKENLKNTEDMARAQAKGSGVMDGDMDPGLKKEIAGLNI
jgi:hypothetical protein